MVKIIGVKSGEDDKKPTRLTYKSQFGDYGLTDNYDQSAVRNALGRYEDIGTVEEIREWLERNNDAKT